MTKATEFFIYKNTLQSLSWLNSELIFKIHAYIIISIVVILSNILNDFFFKYLYVFKKY